ncbi:MAG TPA: carbohydrate ABC transporter permease [Anaerolineales bacterium]|nr:carbohydrate ABC transporter permease [Anaerolineales bacterium]
MITSSKSVSFLVTSFLVLLVVVSVIPFWLLFVSSFTSESYLIHNGYSLFPQQFSLAAYEYLWGVADSIGRAYLMSVIIAAIGVSANLVLTILFAYPLSRKDLPGRDAISFFLFFTMLFNGGLVPTYLVYTNFFHVKDTLAGMIVPNLMMNAFFVIVMRSYFTSNILDEVLEAARIDGANEVQILTLIVLPLSKPIISTIGLMALLVYWNNWTNGIYFLTTRTDLYGIQNYLNAVINKASFLQSQMATMMSPMDIPNVSVRMAIAVIAVLPLLIAYPFFQRSFVKGITLGSVKG